MPTRRTTILADADLLDRVERVCRRTGQTKTALIATALEAYLVEHEAQPALGFVGIGRSGHGRLSLDARRIARAGVGAARGGATTDRTATTDDRRPSDDPRA